MADVVAALGEEPALPIDDVLERVDFGSLRSEAADQHFWQGQPGGWQRLLTPRTARRIQEAHSNVFELLGYSAETGVRTSRRRARAHWNGLLVQPR